MADTELLPCPFCGGSDAFVERLDYTAAYVQCGADVGDGCACLARGPIAVQDDDGEDIPGGAGAIAAWNRRAALASRPAEVDDEGLPGLPKETAWMVPVSGLYEYYATKHAAKEDRAQYEASIGNDVDHEEPEALFTAEQYRQGQRDAVAADRARRDGWISVKDRMPSTDLLPNGDCPSVIALWRPGALAENLVQQMVINTAYLSKNVDSFTHWMHLPSAPSHTTIKEGN